MKQEVDSKDTEIHIDISDLLFIVRKMRLVEYQLRWMKNECGRWSG